MTELLKEEIKGLKKTILLLGRARVEYMRSGRNTELIEKIFQIERQIMGDLSP